MGFTPWNWFYITTYYHIYLQLLLPSPSSPYFCYLSLIATEPGKELGIDKAENGMFSLENMQILGECSLWRTNS